MPDEWVFAYGSNMHVDDLRRWLREHDYSVDEIAEHTRATLADFRLVWNYQSVARRGGAANIEHVPGARLPGIALRMTSRTRAAVDHKEGEAYVRVLRTVELADGTTISAHVYEVRPERCETSPQWPTRAYLDLMIDAAIEHGLPADHVESLRRVTVRD